MNGHVDRAAMTTGESGPDPELIAAFLDGRLHGEDRARAIRLLADSDASLEVFANALRAQPTPETRVIPITAGGRGRGRVWRVAVPLAAAAVIAVVVLPTLARQGRAPDLGASDLVVDLQRNPRLAAQLGSGWEQRAWRVTRGGAPTPDVSSPGSRDSALAFRLGVRTVDLRVALVRSDTAVAARLVDEMVEMLRGVGFSGAVASTHRELAGHLPTDDRAALLERAAGAERDLAELLGTTTFGFGRWAAAAELATRAADTAFFRSDRTGRYVRSAADRGELTAQEARALEAILERIPSGLADADFRALQTLLQGVIRRRAG